MGGGGEMGMGMGMGMGMRGGIANEERGTRNEERGTGNGEGGTGNGERGTGNGESLKVGITTNSKTDKRHNIETTEEIRLRIETRVLFKNEPNTIKKQIAA